MSPLLLLCWLWMVSAAPLSQLPPKDMVNFMKQYGYLIDAGPDTDALYTEEGFKKAIRQMQKYGGLPETGFIDDKTLALMSSPRCGVRDIIREDEEKSNRTKRYVIGAEGWKTKTVTYFVANWPAELGPEVTREKIEKSFKMWSNITPLRFVHKNSMSADIIIAFGRGSHGDGYPFDGSGNILAHAFFPYEHGAYGGDVHFDDDEIWIDGSKGEKDNDGLRYDFYTVAVHELGHSLGLAHSTVSGSIMFPYYKGYNPNFMLDYDDVLAMYQMYIVNGVFEDQLETEPSTTETTKYSSIITTTDIPLSSPTESSVSDYYIPLSTSSTKYTSDDYYEVPQDDHSFTDILQTTPSDIPSSTDESFKESSDEHKTTPLDKGDNDRFSNKTTTPKINGCEGSFDAISLIRNELFVFKGIYMWRLQERGIVSRGSPLAFHYLFYFPEFVKKIDAVYERPTDHYIILFTGKYYWEFTGNRFTEKSPLPLSHLGLPESINAIDAAIVWGKNGRTYLFQGNQYWRYNEVNKTMDFGYPHPIQRWRGVPNNLDCALTWKDGQTYFFKGKDYWRFNNNDVIVDSKFPQPSATHWLGC